MTDLYVCGDPSLPTPYDDNVHGKCECGTKIMWRPHAPTHLKKVCVDCAIMYAKEDEKRGNKVEISATEETIKEVIEFFKRSGIGNV